MKKTFFLVFLMCIFFACELKAFGAEVTVENDNIKSEKEVNFDELNFRVKQIEQKNKEAFEKIQSHQNKIDKELINLSERIIVLKNDVKKQNNLEYLYYLLSALIGGALACAGSLWATKITQSNDRKIRELSLKQSQINFLKALSNEINTLWERYMWGIGEELERLADGHPFTFYYPVTQDYFTVFNNNSQFIGSLQNEELSSEIVEIYSIAKGLVDSYRLNNDFVQKHEHWHWLANETNQNIHLQRAQAQLEALKEYSATLKEIHFKIKEKLPILNNLLTNEIARLSSQSP